MTTEVSLREPPIVSGVTTSTDIWRNCATIPSGSCAGYAPSAAT